MTVRLSPGRVHRYQRLVVTGTVRPDFNRRRVLVQRHRHQESGWQTVVTSAPLTDSAGYRLRVPTGTLGDWRYRILVRTTPTAKTGRSPVVALRVVR